MCFFMVAFNLLGDFSKQFPQHLSLSFSQSLSLSPYQGMEQYVIWDESYVLDFGCKSWLEGKSKS